MKHVQRFLAVAAMLVFAWTAGCASGSVNDSGEDGDGAASQSQAGGSANSGGGQISDDGTAAAVAAAGIGDDSSHTAPNVDWDVDKENASAHLADGSIISLIHEIVAEEVAYDIDQAKTATPTETPDGGTVVTIDRETASLNGGTVTYDGTLTVSDPSRGSGSIGGQLKVTVDNVTDDYAIGGKRYSETVNGTMDLAFNGAFNVDEYGNYFFDYAVRGTTRDMAVTGTVDATTHDLNVTYSLSESTIDPIPTVSCSGSVTVETTSSGVETCELLSDCMGCK